MNNTTLITTCAVSLALGAAITVFNAIEASQSAEERKRVYESFKNTPSYRIIHDDYIASLTKLYEQGLISEEKFESDKRDVDNHSLDMVVLTYALTHEDNQAADYYKQYEKWNQTVKAYSCGATISLPASLFVTCGVALIKINLDEKKKIRDFLAVLNEATDTEQSEQEVEF